MTLKKWLRYSFYSKLAGHFGIKWPRGIGMPERGGFYGGWCWLNGQSTKDVRGELRSIVLGKINRDRAVAIGDEEWIEHPDGYETMSSTQSFIHNPPSIGLKILCKNAGPNALVEGCEIPAINELEGFK